MTGITITRWRLDNLDEVRGAVDCLKGLGCRVVLTSGSFDLLHLGHVRYLEAAKAFGDILIVGVDDDEKIKMRKGDDRPMVPEEERVALLSYQRPVDFIHLKKKSYGKWALIKTVQPDVLVLTADHRYTDRDLADLQAFVGRIEVLERQATMTTSERIRQMYMNLGEKLGPLLAQELPQMIERAMKRS